jgi:hypothetical protein
MTIAAALAWHVFGRNVSVLTGVSLILLVLSTLSGLFILVPALLDRRQASRRDREMSRAAIANISRLYVQELGFEDEFAAQLEAVSFAAYTDDEEIRAGLNKQLRGLADQRDAARRPPPPLQ